MHIAKELGLIDEVFGDEGVVGRKCRVNPCLAWAKSRLKKADEEICEGVEDGMYACGCSKNIEYPGGRPGLGQSWCPQAICTEQIDMPEGDH